jgi:hypothetical protein
MPDGVTSHEDLIGEWFSPNLSTTMRYLRKSTRLRGSRQFVPFAGAQLVVADVPADKLDDLHVSNHPIARTMDVESDNYIIPRTGDIPIAVVPLHDIIGDLRAELGNVRVLIEARERIAARIGHAGIT